MLKLVQSKPTLVIFISCLIGLLTLLVYWPGLSGPFMLDDVQNVVAIQKYTTLDAILYNIVHNDSGLLGRSISVASFFFTQWQLGTDAWGYKLHNLIIHLLIGAALARLIYLILPRIDSRLNKQQSLLIAGLLTGLWLLHPFQVSTVLYAVQRMAQLSILFTLLALLAYFKLRSRVEYTKAYYFQAWIYFPFLMLCALLSKETAVLIPLYIVLFEVLVFKADIKYFRVHRPQAVFLGVFVLLPALLAFVVFVLKFESLTNFSGRNFTLIERLLTEIHAVAFYAKMSFLPQLHSMSLYHDDFTIRSSLDALTVTLFLGLLAVCGLIWCLRNKAPVISFALAWFLISHSLESTFLPLELVFEHRNYLALAGLLLIPVYLLITLPMMQKGWVLLLIFLLIFSFMTFSRATEWGNRELNVTIATTDHPSSPRARNAMANLFLERGEAERALEQLEIASSLNRNDAGAAIHALTIRCGLGLRDEESLQQVNERLSVNPASVYALNTLDSLIEMISIEQCKEVTIEDFAELIESALSLNANVENTSVYSYLLRFRGIYNLYNGRYAEGVISIRLAHEQTGKIGLLAELAKYQIDLGRLDDVSETIEAMNEQNVANFGVETYQIKVVEDMLAKARAAALNDTAE